MLLDAVRGVRMMTVAPGVRGRALAARITRGGRLPAWRSGSR